MAIDEKCTGVKLLNSKMPKKLQYYPTNLKGGKNLLDMLNLVSIFDRESKVAVLGFRISNEESSIFVLRCQKFLLCLVPFYFARVPPEKMDRQIVEP